MSFSNQISNSEIFHALHSEEDLDQLMEKIGDKKYVLLGEASHGTHEYYTWRAQISKKLIEEKGFSFIAVEGDWPDCFAINKWIKGKTEGEISEVLHEFKRWPTWMWANWEIAAFATWLKAHNDHLPYAEKVGFYGLDVYSLWESMEIIVNYLEKEDPETADLAKNALTCFEPYKAKDSYGSIFERSKPGCKEEVVKLLKQVRERAHQYDNEPEADLNAEINSLVMANAEKYYTAMADLGEKTWNIRDRHMMETLNSLINYHGKDKKVIVWEHNTHIGDARATDMRHSGLFNIGQLVREEKGVEDTFLLGFGSYEGSVIAGSRWGAPMRRMMVPEGIPGSFENEMHEFTKEDSLFFFDEPKAQEIFSERIGHRAIGVVYHPERESGNYVPSHMPKRYDGFIFIDKTTALHPLKLEPEGALTPETYPFGI
ncbi:protein-L-isoaspartate O-methyltransferase [Christiangramia fulva]|uniref:Protein-L-isoaspartate O-methyltransferase n=1 Tax=Christiangramia fulva TaxID=2126553 RepID=A0A2R3Z6I0_9FLAO|nr:erythromycin esterase family protein [Christiangramia fulva]AVR45865.1 protein-L-isoaspartate O-methyltransferase [Christiangramia fulva]